MQGLMLINLVPDRFVFTRLCLQKSWQPVTGILVGSYNVKKMPVASLKNS